MSKPEKVIPSLCEGFTLSDSQKTYTQRDVILYALGVGASQDSTDEKDLKFTYENADNFSVIPSFSTVIPDLFENFMSFEKCPGIPEFNPMKLLHGEHKIIIHKTLPTEATVKQISKIKSVEDKKSGALIVLSTQTFDISDNQLLCTNEASLFVRGIGGFSDNSTKKTASKTKILATPTTPPDYIYMKQTSSNQAIIYRLSGDYNPLHIDPNMAQMGGFEKPILHGLCSFGIAVHGAVKVGCNNEAEKIESVSARFSSPVTPGDTLKTEMWSVKDEKNKPILQFKMTNVTTGKVCIESGVIYLKEERDITSHSKL